MQSLSEMSTNPANLAPTSEINFQSLLEKSKALKEEANKHLKSNPSTSLDLYHKSLEVFLTQRPKLVTYREDFHIDWKYPFDESDKKKILEHFSTVFSNCSYLYIEMKKPLMALYYAKFSHWCDESFFKASLRISRALIDLLHLQEAQTMLTKLHSHPDAQKFQTEIKSMLEETSQEITKYSSSQTIVQFLRNSLDWVEEKAYIGPMEIVDTPNKGRAFCATRNISRSEVLLIEKGFVYGEKKAEFCYHLIDKLDKREDLKALYMNLFPCSKYPLTKELKSSIQGKIREHALKSLFNAYKKDKSPTWNNFSEPEIEELLHKAQYDSFRPNGNSALYPHLCIMNHSCDPNTSIWYVQDMVLAIARRDIRQGEEICVTYAPVADDRPQRRAKLFFYGFECDCLRCQQKGEWEQKAHQVNGLRCPECGTEVACNSSKKFVCPKECWRGEYVLYERLDKEIKDMLGKLVDAQVGVNTKLKNALQTVEKNFSHYHNNRALVMYMMAKTYARQQDEIRFKESFREIAKMIEFYPTLELRTILNNLLYEILSNFTRELSDDELGLFGYFGLSLETMKGLWKEFMGSKGKEWFLPFETGSQKPEEDDNGVEA